MTNSESGMAKKNMAVRFLAFSLAAIMMLGAFAVVPVLSVESDPEAEQSQGAQNNSDIKYEQDVLSITVDGEEITELEIYENEKVTIKAEGIIAEKYQWQILHPEKSGLWVDIYEETKETLDVSLALTGNMEQEDGKTYLRCLAYEAEGAYVTDVLSVSTLEGSKPIDAPEIPTVKVETKNPHLVYADGDDHPEFVTVTIEYLRYDFARDSEGKAIVDAEGNPVLSDEGIMAFRSYMATLRYGSSLNTTVPNPTLIGYDAYLDDATETCEEVVINESGITSNIVYTVKYKPAEVDYSVRYYFQNVYDDLYVENTDLKVDAKGFTGSTPPKNILEKDVDGFTALYYQPDSIAADGSTVFEVYYERNYYLMEFNCNEGYGTDTVYARYEAYISVPDPIRHGWEFVGWDLISSEAVPAPSGMNDGVKDTLPPSMPHYDSGYKAIWSTVQTTYTVVYWAENANDSNYSYWGYQTFVRESNTTVSGVAYSYSNNNNLGGKDRIAVDENGDLMQDVVNITAQRNYFTFERADSNVLVLGDGSSVVNVYYTRNIYTLRFSLSGLGTFTPPAVHATHDGENCECTRTHVHGDDCVKSLTCTKDVHTHTEECKTNGCLTCKLEEHEHESSCLSDNCEYADHEHTAECCTIEEHTTHSIDCYDGVGSAANYVYGAPNNPQIGQVYTTNYGYTFHYIYIDGIWYNYENPNNISSGQIASTICTVHTHDGTNCNYCDSPIGHKHTADCCILDEHTIHTIECYNPQSGYVQASNQTGYSDYVSRISAPKEGFVYRYSRNGTVLYYFYSGSTWYYLGSTTLGLAANSAGWTTVNNTNSRVSVCDTPSTMECEIHSHDGINCEYCIHEHTNACTDCGLVEHSHSSECYEKEEHTHSDSCYSWSCGEDSHEHSAECCTKPITYVEGNYYYIKAKYEQSIGYVWPTLENFTNKLSYWKIEGVSNNAVSKRVTMTDDLCNTTDSDRTKDVTGSTTTSSSQQTLFYMFESLNQTDGASGDDRKQINNAGIYYDRDGLYDQKVYSTATNWSQKQITGMAAVSNGVKYESNSTKVFFYYTRARYGLSFYNYNAEIAEKQVDSVMYEQLLSGYRISKSEMEEKYYPSTLEPGAYEFAGWYTTPQCFKGTEVDWDKITMPNKATTLYAKWTPLIRKVTFYSAYSDIQKDKDDTSDKIYHFMLADNISHGSLLGSSYSYTPDYPTDMDLMHDTTSGLAQMYDFVGWFYMDENGKKRFAPDSMEITRDLVLFAEWNTSVDTTYEIQYVLGEDVYAATAGTSKNYAKGDPIADTLFAHSSVGKTKTFDAKGVSELYSDFKQHFFPTVSSHSILMEQNGELNKFTFEYVYDPIVYYKVRYVDYVTRTEILPSVTRMTEEAIVTEKFAPKQGWIPQNYYITKSLASDGDSDGSEVIEENIITFYYTQDTLHGLYSIEYYLENSDSNDSSNTNNYYKYESIVGSADLNQTVTATIRPFEGYTYKPSLNTVITYNVDGTEKETLKGASAGDPPRGKVDYTGLTIKIYYACNEYDYEFIFREYGAKPTDADLQTSVTGKAKFGSVVSITAPATIDKTIDEELITYEYNFSDMDNPDIAELTKSVTIREFEEGETNPNKQTFWYVKKQYPVEYHVVCTVPDLGGLNGLDMYYETAPVASTLAGSLAMAGTGFQFKGWFDNADCTGTPLTTDAKFKPTTITPEEDGIDHYYALFEPLYGSLTIIKHQIDGAAAAPVAPTESFLFHVKGLDNNNKHIDMVVTITDAGSKTINKIPIGDYEVTEMGAWSWTFASPNGDLIALPTVIEGETAEAHFYKIEPYSDWLTGEKIDYKE